MTIKNKLFYKNIIFIIKQKNEKKNKINRKRINYLN